MIELFSSDTPNGKKISIMLEEIGCDFKVTKIDISKDEQFKLEFKKISPFSKIPVIRDHENGNSIFESGAILIYLGEKYNKFYELDNRNIINQWLMAQMGTIGPMIGQHHQFHHYNPGKSEFGEERFFKIVKRIYGELDERLSTCEYLAGKKYTIADIATWPWVRIYEWSGINIEGLDNLKRWLDLIAERPACIKGITIPLSAEDDPKETAKRTAKMVTR